MLKKFNPIIDDKPIIFYEDIYLFADSGKVLIGRSAGNDIKNIFSLIDEGELDFIRSNMFFAGMHPLLLVESDIGPIFIDVSLFGGYRLFVAIIPHFCREEVLTIAKEKLRSIVLFSKKVKDLLDNNDDIAICERHEDFAQRLLLSHRGAYYYRVHGRTNGEISMMISEIAYDLACVYGCELELLVRGVGLFEMKNDLCVDSYVFALTNLLLVARNYSSARKARLDIVFNEMGIYFEFGFEISDEYRTLSLLSELDALKNFKFRASSRLFDCDYYQDDRAFAVRAYPWYKRPDSADLKEKKTEFIYNM